MQKDESSAQHSSHWIENRSIAIDHRGRTFVPGQKRYSGRRLSGKIDPF